MPTSKNIEEIKALAMSDELFEPEVLEPYWITNYDCDQSHDWQRPKRITVIQKEKHFRNHRFISLPSFNEDVDEEKECEVM